jgi:hypothetical protein
MINVSTRFYDPETQGWQEVGLCSESLNSSFFDGDDTETPNEASSREEVARAICKLCAFTEPCLEEALKYQEINKATYGVIGGLNEKERTALLKKQKQQSSSV